MKYYYEWYSRFVAYTQKPKIAAKTAITAHESSSGLVFPLDAILGNNVGTVVGSIVGSTVGSIVGSIVGIVLAPKKRKPKDG